MEDCLFCKIVKGEIPSDKIFENDDVLSFLDINPINIGHALVIPKKHYENTYETPDDTVSKVAIAVKKITIAVKKALKADGVNIMINNDKDAGQVVFHSHTHVIPRFKNDGHVLWAGDTEIASKNNETAEKIKKALQ